MTIGLVLSLIIWSVFAFHCICTSAFCVLFLRPHSSVCFLLIWWLDFFVSIVFQCVKCVACFEILKTHEYANKMFYQNHDHFLFASHVCTSTWMSLTFEILQLAASNCARKHVRYLDTMHKPVKCWSYNPKYFIFGRHTCFCVQFFTFMSLTPEVCVLETSDLTHVLCINSKDNIVKYLSCGSHICSFPQLYK